MQGCKSIGYYRDSDGDFAILATVNNNDESMTDSEFNKLVTMIVNYLNESVNEPIQALDRQDAPDYVDSEGDSHSY